ncbi:unnamed protein product [Polarella glacialis]|uniref:Uncharacterized protein n=1 Tax=Polarella glacialis TaxID=89957 RepID=A0A813ITS4_POLGL|nr:unnamed protein product [Polarella glacialis]CAE8656229.1 unnamed protein product [Polarella glacialis]
MPQHLPKCQRALTVLIEDGQKEDEARETRWTLSSEPTPWDQSASFRTWRGLSSAEEKLGTPYAARTLDLHAAEHDRLTEALGSIKVIACHKSSAIQREAQDKLGCARSHVIPTEAVASATAEPTTIPAQQQRNAARESCLKTALAGLSTTQELLALHAEARDLFTDFGGSLLQELATHQQLHETLGSLFAELRTQAVSWLNEQKTQNMAELEVEHQQQKQDVASITAAAAAAIHAIQKQKKAETELQRSLILEKLARLDERQRAFLKANHDPDQHEPFRKVLDSMKDQTQLLEELDGDSSSARALEELVSSVRASVEEKQAIPASTSKKRRLSSILPWRWGE